MGERLYFMNNIKPIRLQGLDPSGFKKTHMQELRRIDRKVKTEGNGGREERETMQLRAKAHLFQEAEVHNQKQITKFYSNTKNQREAKRQYFTLGEEQITAFEDNSDSLRRQETQPQPNIKTIKNRIERTQISSELSNHQTYWNRKHHHQIMVLRPAILNPTITIQLNQQSELRSSPKAKYVQSFHQIQSRKDFEAAIRQYAKKTKEIYNNHDVSRIRMQERNRKAVSISKRLSKLRSKSTSFIQEEQHRNQMISQLEKLTARCEFEIQIKCLNPQKQQLDSSKTKAAQSNKDLQIKIRNLIIKENKKIKVANEQEDAEQKIAKINEKAKVERLLHIHNRSKSCVASTFKGPQNKKLKIATILSKLIKFKAEQDRRKCEKQDDEGYINKSLEFIKANMRKIEQREKQPLSCIQQEQFQGQGAKKALLTSIKIFCRQKKAHLPFVSNLTRNGSIAPPPIE